jgi:tetrahydromethanopterin S-methyltransferase subunit A
MLVLRRKSDGTYPTYREVVDLLAHIPQTDTDTNAAIAGALAGAFDGFTEMVRDPITANNLRIIVEVNGIDYQKYMTGLFG